MGRALVAGVLMAGMALASGCAGGKAAKAPDGAAPGAASAASVTAPEPEPEPVSPANTVKVATIRTERGTIRMALLDSYAPNTVKNFVSLISRGFYNGLTFHRVESGVLIQGGDPKGDGTGNPGFTIKAEFNAHPHIPGAVGMARTMDPDSANCQFYICLRALPFLDGKYTVFAQVFEGLDVVGTVQKGDRMLEVRVEDWPKEKVPADALK